MHSQQLNLEFHLRQNVNWSTLINGQDFCAKYQYYAVDACGVGLKNGNVKNEDITASSIFSSKYEPYFGRLDRKTTLGTYGGWLGKGDGKIFIQL